MKTYRWIAAILVILCVLGCGRGKKQESAEEESGVLTGVYRAEWTLSPEDDDGFRVTGAVHPFYDAEADTLTVCLVKLIEDEDGLPISEEKMLCTYAKDGQMLSSVPIPSSELLTFDGVITSSGFLWRSYRYGDRSEVTLSRCAPDGSDLVTVNCAERYGVGMNQIITVSIVGSRLAERDGTVLMAADSRLLVLDDRLEMKTSLNAEEFICGVGFLADGSPVYTVSEKAFALDPASWKEKLYAATPARIQFFLIGGDGELYYDAQEGVFRWTPDGPVLAMSKRNSSIPDGLSLLGVPDGENLLYRDSARKELTVVRHAPDIDLSDVKTITVAAVYPLKQYVDARIKEYNRTHPELRVVIDDRSDPDFNTEGADQLAFEMVNGTSKPDILLSVGTDGAAKALLAKGWYIDLLPYLEKDPTVRADDLFASVKTAFTDKDGRLWAVAPYFNVRTVMGRRDVLGAYADQGSWTLEEFVSFASTLPSDVAVGPYIRQDAFSTILGAASFNNWIDYEAGTCDFTGEDFAALLRLIRSLPKDYDEYDRRYPYMEHAFDDGPDSPFLNGKIVLAFYFLNGLQGCLSYQERFGTYGTDDLVFIGYPTVNGRSSNVISAMEACMITSFCEDPDAAWDVIRCLFTPPEQDTDWLNGDAAMQCPSLKSTFALARQTWDAYYICRNIENGYTSYVKRSEHSLEDLQKVNEVFALAPEYIDWIEAMLDDGDVTPILDYTPGEIMEIIYEEVSAYLGKGNGEAECAALIQSRVSLWLAEHH